MTGIVGIVAKDDCKEDLFYSTDYHSHLGTEYGGVAITDGDRLVKRVHSIKRTQFKSKFVEDFDFQTFHGNKGIGVISDRDYQPLTVSLNFGEFAMVGVGYINNQDELTRKLIADGETFCEMREGKVNQIELAANLINKKDNLIDGINYMHNNIEGSMSLLFLSKEGVYAARAKEGHTPLIFAEKKDSKIVAFETCSYKNRGYGIKRSLGPGEIVFLNEKGEEQLQKPNDRMQFCTFLYVYTGFPGSDYEGKNVASFRVKSGELIAKNDNVELDQVCGVADSGSIYAYGYAHEKKIPVIPVTAKYSHGWQRSYTPPKQSDRDFIAMMKQVVSEELTRGKRIGITEDSIVRGTQLKNAYLTKLWKAGAKETHVRPACPALMWPCKFLFSTRTMDELFARRVIEDINGGFIEDVSAYLDPESSQYKEMIKNMERNMETTTLKYQRLEDMVLATGLPKEKLCTYCWDGCEGCE